MKRCDERKGLMRQRFIGFNLHPHEKKSTDQAEEILAVDYNRLVWITLFFS
jgi:flagellar biosynthesis regulator FlaF